MTAGVRTILRAKELAGAEVAARSLNPILMGIYLRLEAEERRTAALEVEVAGVGSTTFTNGTVLASTTTIQASDTATALPASALANRRKVTLKNRGQSVVYVGGAGVTAAAGLPLEIGEQLDLAVGPDVRLYGLVATGDTACDVRVLEFAE